MENVDMAHDNEIALLPRCPKCGAEIIYSPSCSPIVRCNKCPYVWELEEPCCCAANKMSVESQLAALGYNGPTHGKESTICPRHGIQTIEW